MKIAYTLNSDLTISSWRSYPIYENDLIIDIDNPENIHIGIDKIINNKLVINDIEYNRIEALQRDTAAKYGRIDELKQLLKNSDYKVMKYLEGYSTEEEYLPIKEQRQQARDEINRLELELESLTK